MLRYARNDIIKRKRVKNQSLTIIIDNLVKNHESIS